MKIRFIASVLFTVMFLAGCQAAKNTRIAEGSHFVSLSRPKLQVECSSDFKYLPPQIESEMGGSAQSGTNTVNVNYENYYFVNADENMVVKSAVLVRISTLKTSRWYWNPIQFREWDSLEVDNNNNLPSSKFRSVVRLMDDFDTEHIEYGKNMGYKFPELMVEKTLGKITTGTKSQQIFVSYIESANLPKYTDVDWAKVKNFKGPARDALLKIFNAGFDENVAITE